MPNESLEPLARVRTHPVLPTDPHRLPFLHHVLPFAGMPPRLGTTSPLVVSNGAILARQLREAQTRDSTPPPNEMRRQRRHQRHMLMVRDNVEKLKKTYARGNRRNWQSPYQVLRRWHLRRWHTRFVDSSVIRHLYTQPFLRRRLPLVPFASWLLHDARRKPTFAVDRFGNSQAELVHSSATRPCSRANNGASYTHVRLSVRVA